MTNRNYSQCPGECYDSFWDTPPSPPIDIDDLFKKWADKTAPKFYVKYRKGDGWREHKCKSMGEAIALANTLLVKGFVVDSVYTETPSDLAIQ